MTDEFWNHGYVIIVLNSALDSSIRFWNKNKFLLSIVQYLRKRVKNINVSQITELPWTSNYFILFYNLSRLNFYDLFLHSFPSILKDNMLYEITIPKQVLYNRD